MSVMLVELQTPLDEYSLVCRGCLAGSGEMKNIREWGLIEDFCKLADVKIHNTVGISELLCTSCEDILITCKRFREQCQQSDMVLRNIAMQKEQDTKSENECSNHITFHLNDKSITYSIIAPDTESKINIPCPYLCNNTYIKKKDLSLHLDRAHNIKDMEINIQFYCHHVDCSYNMSSKKSFDKRKNLNQHFNRIHRIKLINCEQCRNDFINEVEYNRHLKSCNVIYKCAICDLTYKTNERLLVHLMRHHPDLHKDYKRARKAEKQCNVSNIGERKKQKLDYKFDYTCDSPKRTSGTQTSQIKNDVALPPWHTNKMDYNTKTDEISTQTADDFLSIKSQSEDDSIFCSESVSLSAIQTQTSIEFGLSRSNKQTTTETQPLNIKETQTCICLYDSPKPQFKLFDSVSSSPNSVKTSTETQTIDFSYNVSDVLLSFNSAETQTCFDECEQL